MTALTRKFFRWPAGRLLALLVLGALLAACGKSESSGGSAAALAKVDACALVPDSMLAKYAPHVGKGHPGAIPKGSPVSTCVWSDARHIPELILTVGPRDPSGVAKGLQQGMGNMGYKIVPLSGLGDEAAVAIQQANPKLHTKTAIAELAVRVGKRQFSYSPIRPMISGTASPAFGRLKDLAADTANRLQQGH